MYSAEVVNFMGCEKAEVKFDKAALICGLNHQGKSSFLNAVAAALTGEAVPFGLKKSDCGMLVKIGNTSGSVKVQNDQTFETVKIAWPKAEIFTDGKNPPACSKISAGIESLIEMKEKERSEFIREMTRCNPKKEDLAEFLKERGIENEKVVDKVWTYVEQDGFEASHKRACDSGRAFKQQWSNVTGEAYGSQKAETWQPAGWNSDLIDVSIESIDANLTAARAELEDMIVRQAVDDSKADEYRELANETSLKVARDNAKICKDNVDTYKKELYDIDAKLSELNRNVEEQPCPHCGAMLTVSGGKIKAVEEKPEDQTEKIEQLQTKKQDILQSISDNESKYLKYNSEVAQRVKAFEELEKINASAGSNITQVDIDKKRNQISQIENQREAFKAMQEAQRLCKNIKENQIIIDALDMSGIRKKAMENGLYRFNLFLLDISKQGGWQQVQVENDLTITLGGRPYVLLSESEKYRVRLTLQISISLMQESQLMIIDGAEILDKKGKNGLFNILLSNKVPALIGMMISDVDKVPNMKKFGVSSYWVEQGNAKEI